MRKIIFLLLLFLFLLFPKFTFAHFPEKVGDLTVTLHVDPDDNPTPNKQANLYFLFYDASGKFELSKCNCVVSVYKNDKQIFSQKLLEPNNSKPSIWGTKMPFIFPDWGEYDIVIKGNPISKDDFQYFFDSWEFSVDPNTPGLITKRPSELPMILLFVVLGVIGLGAFAIFVKKEILEGENK
ncbi:MAG TPA: hypothetical protein VF189_02240 [Patescibacteria group bacterium]